MAAARPRALFVAPMVPARSRNGLAMRLGIFLEALAAWADVDLAVIPVAGGRLERTRFLDSLDSRMTVHEITPETGTHFSLLSRLADPAARCEAFKQYGKPSLASGLSPRVIDAIARLVRRNGCDLVHVTRSYMIPAIAAIGTRIPLALDFDEDDRASFFSRAVFARRHGQAPLAEWLEQEGRACDDLIAAHCGRIHRAFASSRRDCVALSRRHPDLAIEPVLNAVDIPRRIARSDDGRTAVFVGSFGYPPNADAVLWFAQSVLPRIEARIGRIRLVVAGVDPPRAVRALGRRPNIRVLGGICDLAPVYRRASIAIAPMRGGGGTRIKLLEAASFAVPVVANEDSAAPLFGRAHRWGWAPRAADFAAACAEAFCDPRERERRGELGYSAVARWHARPAILARLARTLRAACETERAAPTWDRPWVTCATARSRGSTKAR